MRTVGRAGRLLYMIDLLKDRPRTVAELAERCHVSERTVRRDLEAMQGEPLRVPLVLKAATWSVMRWRDEPER